MVCIFASVSSITYINEKFCRVSLLSNIYLEHEWEGKSDFSGSSGIYQTRNSNSDWEERKHVNASPNIIRLS